MLGKGVASSQIAKLIETVLAFFISVLLTRWMGPDRFGTYSLILGWIGLVGLTTSLGFSSVLNRYIPRLMSESVEISSLFIPLLIIRLFLIILISSTIKLFDSSLLSWLRHSELVPYVGYILVWFSLIQVNDLFWSFYLSQFRIIPFFLSRTLAQVTVIGLVFLLFGLRKSSLQLALIIQCVAYALGTAVYLLAYKRIYSRQSRKWLPSQFGHIFKFGLSAWAIAIVTFFLSEQTDVLLLGYFVQDTSSVAYYKVGTSLVWKLLGVITIGSQIVLSVLSTLYHNEAKEGLSRGWSTFVKLSTLTIIPVYLFLGWYAPKIITLLYGVEYSHSLPILYLFLGLTAIPFGFLGGGVSLMALYSIGREKEGLLIRIIYGTINVVLSVILIRSQGAIGAVIATGASQLLSVLLEYLILHRFVPQQYPWAFGLKIAASAIMSIPVLILFPANTLLGLISAGSAYGVAMALVLLIWKPLTNTDCELIKRINPKLATVASRFWAIQ